MRNDADEIAATITPAAAAFGSATAIELRQYTQTIVNANVAGVVDQVSTPWASQGLGLSFGAEYREENGKTTPDECLKLAPTSCLGGAGGNVLPIEGGFSTTEFYVEGIMPLVEGYTGVESLDLELGFRTANFDPSGVTESWKYGLSYEPIPGLRDRPSFAAIFMTDLVPPTGDSICVTLENEGFGILKNVTITPNSGVPEPEWGEGQRWSVVFG